MGRKGEGREKTNRRKRKEKTEGRKEFHKKEFLKLFLEVGYIVVIYWIAFAPNLHQFSLVTQLCPTLWSHGLQHTRLPCLSPTPRVYLNSCPLSQWCHPPISSFVVPFSSSLQSFPASGSFQMSQFFPSGVLSIGVSASPSVLPMNIQDWFPLGWKS